MSTAPAFEMRDLHAATFEDEIKILQSFLPVGSSKASNVEAQACERFGVT